MKANVQDAVKVPSLPMVFARINTAVNDPRSSMADIGTILSEDPALAARLLKIVNSGLFTFSSKIDSIGRAITVVGTQQLRDLVLATTVTRVFKGISEDLISMESFWHHSVACGVTARILATYRNEPNIERFFVGGILHDLGLLVMYMKKPAQSRAALLRCRATGELLHKVEKVEVGCSHAAVGGALLRTWKLPASLEEVVAFHHTPRLAKRFPVDVAIVHVADIIVHVMQIGNNGESLVPPMDPEAWERMELSTSILSPTMEQVKRQFDDAIHLIISNDAI